MTERPRLQALKSLSIEAGQVGVTSYEESRKRRKQSRKGSRFAWRKVPL